MKFSLPVLSLLLTTFVQADTPVVKGYLQETSGLSVGIISEDTGGLWLKEGQKYRTLKVIKVTSPSEVYVEYRSELLKLSIYDAPKYTVNPESGQQSVSVAPIPRTPTLVMPAPPANATRAQLQDSALMLSEFLHSMPPEMQRALLQETMSQMRRRNELQDSKINRISTEGQIGPTAPQNQ